MYKASKPLLKYMKERNIQPVTYCGLAPINRVDEGPLDSILPTIAQRLSTSVGESVSPGQVLQLWLRKQGLPYVSYVKHCLSRREYPPLTINISLA